MRTGCATRQTSADKYRPWFILHYECDVRPTPVYSVSRKTMATFPAMIRSPSWSTTPPCIPIISELVVPPCHRQASWVRLVLEIEPNDITDRLHPLGRMGIQMYKLLCWAAVVAREVLLSERTLWGERTWEDRCQEETKLVLLVCISLQVRDSSNEESLAVFACPQQCKVGTMN